MRKNNTAIIFGSLFFSCSVMAANGTLAPTVVPMVNGGQASIAISNTSPNLFTVPGDRIIAVNSLDGALTNNEQTASGGVVVATVNKKPFTFILETERGLNLSIQAVPREGAGRTIQLVSDLRGTGEEAGAWETSTPYESLLVTISQAVRGGKLPAGWYQVPVTKETLQAPAGLSSVADAVWTGNHLKMVRFAVENKTLSALNIRESDFWHVAMRTLPMTQTILTGIAIGIFPLLVLAAVFNKLTLSVLKGYVFALMWLQSWPLLYAILNSAMTFYAKQNGAPVVLSEISQIQLKYSDLASTAGYLSMMIPPLSWMMVRGLGAGFSSVYSHFASSAISPTASAAGSVVDGNYSYGNMQTENVNGFSWSTNSTTSFGQMMYQTGSGATATQTRDGNMVMDASGAMSRLPVGINATRQIAVAQQEMAREASNRAESALHGFSSSIASAWNTLSQFGSNRGSSDSVTSGADSTMSAQDSMMASRMRSAVESYAKAHNISNEQATQELASRSTRASAGMYGDAHAEWGVKPKILGVGGGLGVRGGGRAGIDWSDDDAHQASSGSRASYDARHDIDAKASKDFKEASDYFTSRKVSESGSHTDNNADSRVDQLSAALNSAKQSYDQYTTNMTRSHEYAEMASRTESMSGQMSEDLSQQFAQYVMKHAPQDAEAILTNTSSPEIAERRRAMAWSFVQEQIQPGVDNAWRESRGDIGKGMESVPSGGGSQDIIADHQGHQAIIEQRTQDSNIRNDVKHQVDNMVTEYKGNIGDTQNSIRGEENIVRGQYSELQNHHKTEALSQNNKYNEEKSAQERMPGADSPQELMKRAKEYQDKYKQ
ncbi:TPA: conjugal transfer mating-pair stabilization protein TraG [Escherichia coli]